MQAILVGVIIGGAYLAITSGSLALIIVGSIFLGLYAILLVVGILLKIANS